MDLFAQFTPELEGLWQKTFESDPDRWPFYKPEWHRSWYAIFGNGESLCIATNGIITLPLAVKDRVLHFTGGEEIADYLDAVGPNSGKMAAWKELLPLTGKLGADSLLLRNIPDGSATLDFFRSVSNALIEQEDTTPTADLSDSFDSYVSRLNRKNRHELKRKVRKFEDSYPDTGFSVRHGSDTDIPILLGLMKNDEDKKSFLTAGMERFFQSLVGIAGTDIMQFFVTAGKDNDAVIATTLAFRVNDMLLLYNSGFDRNYVGAGFYLKAKTIEWAIANGIRTYNFLQGNERYKYELGGIDHPVWRVSLPL